MAAQLTQIPLEAHALAALYPHRTAKGRDVVIVPQMQHRIDLIKYWGIKAGDKVLEIGCGQGDCTLVLAAAVGESGYVTAIDPASLDYGGASVLRCIAVVAEPRCSRLPIYARAGASSSNRFPFGLPHDFRAE